MDRTKIGYLIWYCFRSEVRNREQIGRKEDVGLTDFKGELLNTIKRE